MIPCGSTIRNSSSSSRDNNTMECLKYCRKKLIDCNFDDYKGSWNDQLYVTDWSERFNNIGVVKNPGINLTPFEYDEWGNYSILLSDQYYTDDYEYLVATYGKYQTGFIGFRNNEDSLECLKWW